MANEIDPHLFGRKWVHSHEEDTPSEMVFRPESFPMPPSRGRKSFQLGASGQLQYSGPGPDDRTKSSQGTWSIDKSNLLTLKPDVGATTEMQILSVKPDKLVVKKE